MPDPERSQNDTGESEMTTGLVWHERYMWHDTRHAAAAFPSGGWIEPDTHAENPLTKRRFKNLMDASGLTPQLRAIEPRTATVEEICRFHDRAYVDHIKALSDDNGGDAGGLTPFGPGSYEIALLSAGGVMAACDAVLDGEVGNVYALVRPPGHHALAGEGMGFCLFGNVAVAAHHLRVARGLARVAIVDWDVHHGNGTQSAFYGDPSVLTISLHQDGCFPLGSGSADDNGEGAGAGANINIPLPRGGGRGAYVAAFERVVVPALERFSPDFILVASGLDASAMDPLGRMQMHSDAYRELTKLMMDTADRCCEGRLVVEHEGGYSSAYVPFCGLAIVEQLSGLASGVEDPMLGFLVAQGGDELAPHEDAAIAACEPLVGNVPAP